MAPANGTNQGRRGGNGGGNAGGGGGGTGGDGNSSGIKSAGGIRRVAAPSPSSATTSAIILPDVSAGDTQCTASSSAAAQHQHQEQQCRLPTAWDERGGLALLVLLYMMQGVPLGLTLGAMPFMLSSKLSFTQMGIFSLAAYPYSLKLLWSPIVDSCYSRWMGRRKSWIVPVQLTIAVIMVCLAGRIQLLFDAADVWGLTRLFLLLVFLAATQDIAVDGWALELLSTNNVGYAATCQTIGTSSGYFTSFTVFLALHNPKFCNVYLRRGPLGALLAHLGVSPEHHPEGLVSLHSYLVFWGWAFVATTLLLFFVREHEPRSEGGIAGSSGSSGSQDLEQQAVHVPLPASQRLRPLHAAAHTTNGDSGSVGAVRHMTADGAGASTATPPSPAPRSTLSEVASAYRQLWGVAKLSAVWQLAGLLVTYRLGVLAAEGAYTLKLIDKGVSMEALAFLVMFQFPVELLSAVVAGHWASAFGPSRPFLVGYFVRLVLCAGLVALTAAFPTGGETSIDSHPRLFALLAAASLAMSFISTLCFTSLGSFFNSISDPAMGGAYLTLLNTLANVGYLVPRTPIFALMDWLTVPACLTPDGVTQLLPRDLACPKKPSEMLGAAGAASACGVAGGTCSLVSDGFYRTASGSLLLGLALGAAYLLWLPALMQLPLSRWRAPLSRTPSAAAREHSRQAAAHAAPATGGARQKGKIGKRA